MTTSRLTGLCLAILLLGALNATPAADARPRAGEETQQDDSSLLERILITPPSDEYSARDRRRHRVEKSLPGLGTETPVPETGSDQFLEALLHSDINKAGP